MRPIRPKLFRQKRLGNVKKIAEGFFDNLALTDSKYMWSGGDLVLDGGVRADFLIKRRGRIKAKFPPLSYPRKHLR